MVEAFLGPNFSAARPLPRRKCHTRWIAFEWARWAGLERLGRHHMYGWDCFDAIPIDWHLMAVFPTCEDEVEEFVYSEDLWATYGLAELWVSGVCACVHGFGGRGAGGGLNTMNRRMIVCVRNVAYEQYDIF